MPSAGESGVPSASVMGWAALWVSKQYQGSPRPAGAAPPADRSPVQHHEAEQVGELVADPTLPVVQVGVAHPARLDGDQRLTRTGIGNVDHLAAPSADTNDGYRGKRLRPVNQSCPVVGEPPDLRSGNAVIRFLHD